MTTCTVLVLHVLFQLDIQHHRTTVYSVLFCLLLHAILTKVNILVARNATSDRQDEPPKQANPTVDYPSSLQQDN